MGGCTSEEEQKSRMIDRDNERDHQVESDIIKLLLLGAGESGKSTIFKQMKVLYGNGFDERDKTMMSRVVHSNVITSIKVLIIAAEESQFEIKDQVDRKTLMDAPDDVEITPELGLAIGRLWRDSGIMQAYDNRNKFQLNDSAEYFFNAIERISVPHYVASDDDIFHCRIRTSGIVTEKYTIDGVCFEMYDVGGQRNERKKWIHCFDSVTSVIFVAALSEYDQVLYEDHRQNRLEEAISLFKEISNSVWFKHASMILFLNKKDLFEKKIRRVPINQPPMIPEGHPMFPDYSDGICTCPAGSACTCGVYDKALNYIRSKFLGVVETKDGVQKRVYPHVTCATDTENVSHVFDSCKETILKKNLEGSTYM